MSIDVLNPFWEPPSLGYLPEDDIILEHTHSNLIKKAIEKMDLNSSIFSLVQSPNHGPEEDGVQRVLGPLITPEETSNIKKLRWMSLLDDLTPLSSLSIPGTNLTGLHSLAPSYLEGSSILRQVPVLRQLEMGIRALDIGYSVRKGDIVLAYGSTDVKLIEILKGLNSWLMKYPSEIIYVSFRNTDANGSSTSEWLDQLLEDTSDFWMEDCTPVTTLGQARGKMVLLDKTGFSSGKQSDLLQTWTWNDSVVTMPRRGDTPSRAESSWWMNGPPRDVEQQIDRRAESSIAQLETVQSSISAVASKDSGLFTFPSFITRTYPCSAEYPKKATRGPSSSYLSDLSRRAMIASEMAMALGRGDVPGVNGQLVDWLKDAPRKPVGIVFLDLSFVRRKRTPDFQWDDSALEVDNELIHLLIDQNFDRPPDDHQEGIKPPSISPSPNNRVRSSLSPRTEVKTGIGPIGSGP